MQVQFGSVWWAPPAKLADRNLDKVIEMVKAVNAEGQRPASLWVCSRKPGRETCRSRAGFLQPQSRRPPKYDQEIISTWTYDDRLNTLEHLRNSGIKLCCGGIVGMGESARDRVGMLVSWRTCPSI